jgi:hypothetical protein
MDYEKELINSNVFVELKLLRSGDMDHGSILYYGMYKGIFSLSGKDMIVLENGWYYNASGLIWKHSGEIEFEIALIRLEDVISITKGNPAKKGK